MANKKKSNQDKKVKRAKRAKEKAKTQRLSKQKLDKPSNDEVNKSNIRNFRKRLDKGDKQPTTWFGYNREREPNEDPLSIPTKGLLCMISEIIVPNQQAVIDETGIDFNLGDWFLSESLNIDEKDDDDQLKEHEHRVHGPFENEESAMTFGKGLGVKMYRGAPQLQSA